MRAQPIRTLAGSFSCVHRGIQPGGSTTVSDIDLRSAVYLAGRLLATLYGVTIDQVTP